MTECQTCIKNLGTKRDIQCTVLFIEVNGESSDDAIVACPYYEPEVVGMYEEPGLDIYLEALEDDVLDGA